MWANDRWKANLFPSNSRSSDFLAHYSRYFNTVEGNTTFYADPNPDTILRWAAAVPSDFRFSLKVPKRLSHQIQADALIKLRQWLALIQPLQAQLGFIHLQFSQNNPLNDLSMLHEFVQEIHNFAPCCVEVRHNNFFDKAHHEQALHQVLRTVGSERMCFDSRALFAVPATTAELIEAQAKKPRLPVHVVALTSRPAFRFIGTDDLAHNRNFYQPWLNKMQQWLLAGKTPYAFFHTPDNRLAPLLARQFAEDLRQLTGISHPVLAPWPEELNPIQPGLF